MPRKKHKTSRNECTYCGKVHKKGLSGDSCKGRSIRRGRPVSQKAEEEKKAKRRRSPEKNQRNKLRNEKRRVERRALAEAQNARSPWRGMAKEEQLDELDRKFGKAQGARRQRSRIWAAIKEEVFGGEETEGEELGVCCNVDGGPDTTTP